MKKLFLGLIATVMLCFVGNAQTKLSPDMKSVVDAQMITLVHAAKLTYTKGMSSTDWMKQNASVTLTKEEQLLLQKLFSYLSNGTADSEILKLDNSVLYQVAKSAISDSPDVANRFCLRCILETIKEIIEVIIKHLPD
jgi:hypothetical protein